MVLFWCGAISMSSGWGLMKRKQGGSMALLLLLASSAAPSVNTLTFRSSAKPQPKESISMLRTPKRSAGKLSGWAKVTIDWLLASWEREREEKEARGLVRCFVGFSQKKIFHQNYEVKRADSIQYTSVQTGGSFQGKKNTLKPNLSTDLHLLRVCSWS